MNETSRERHTEAAAGFEEIWMQVALELWRIIILAVCRALDHKMGCQGNGLGWPIKSLACGLRIGGQKI
jgi:hypothetical protein